MAKLSTELWACGYITHALIQYLPFATCDAVVENLHVKVDGQEERRESWSVR